MDATVLGWQLYFFATALNVPFLGWSFLNPSFTKFLRHMCRHAFLSDLVRFGRWRFDDRSPVLSSEESSVTSATLEEEDEDDVNTKEDPAVDPVAADVELSEPERGERSLRRVLSVGNETNIVVD